MPGSALRAMVSFFTVWRQDITQEDMDAMERRFHLAPAVGALLGVLALVLSAVLVWLQRCIGLGNGLFTAIVVLGAVFAASRFLHFDGLADFGDGSVVSGTREDHVRALKDTLIGAGGLGVALTVTLLNFAEYSMAGTVIVALAACTEVLVKNAQVAAAAFGTPGAGMAGRQVSETNAASAAYSTVLALVLALVLGAVGVYAANLAAGFDACDLVAVAVAAAAGTVASVAAGWLMARRSNRVFGMVNGDVLGATNEISRAVVMFVMIAAYLLVVRWRRWSTPVARAPAWGGAGSRSPCRESAASPRSFASWTPSCRPGTWTACSCP